MKVISTTVVCSLVLTQASLAQQRFEAPENAFYRYDANDGEGVFGPGGSRYVFDSLDGTWSHGASPDRWDGSEVGTGNPGGVTVSGGTIQIQDPGDPRDHGIEDPSNRRLVFVHNLSADGAGATLLDEGVTLYFRARVPSTGDDIYPSGGGPVIPYPPEGDGYVIHGGGWGGPLSIRQLASGSVSFGLTTGFDSESSGGLVPEAGLVTHNLNGTVPTGWIEQDRESERGGTVNFIALDTLQWHDYYITIQRGGAGTHRVTVYLDGELTPAVEWDVTAGAGHFNDDISYVALAAASTEQSGSIEIDFLVVAPGVAPPRSARTVFRRGDCNGDGAVDISDAVSTLGSLFLGDSDPGCDDACDSNDDGAVDISDAIATLGVLYLGNGVIPLPGMTRCGVDPTDDNVSCAEYNGCP